MLKVQSFDFNVSGYDNIFNEEKHELETYNLKRELPFSLGTFSYIFIKFEFKDYNLFYIICAIFKLRLLWEKMSLLKNKITRRRSLCVFALSM